MTLSHQGDRARKGDLVRVHITVLEPAQRADNLPPATRSVPYEGWIKGLLQQDSATIGDTVQIETLIGRIITGQLESINPVYDHNFGEPQPELNTVGLDAWKRLEQRGRSE